MRSVLILTALLGGLAACQPVTQTAAPVAAPEVQAADTTALKARVNSFNAAFARNDYSTVVAVMPPRLVKTMAAKAGLPVSQFTSMMVSTTESLMEDAKVHSVDMRVPENAIRQSGQISYALLPTTTDLTVLGNRMKTTTTTVALKDSGTWYLARVENEGHERLLKSAYPELKRVKLR